MSKKRNQSDDKDNFIFPLAQEEGVLLVDSRLVAERLGIKHKNFMDNAKKFQTQTEQAFGMFRFETGTLINS